ncbi:MAG: SPASM domain-containing protein [Chlorobiaceae bacterium]
MANIDHGYVVAPNGELYKCWKDVGRKSMIAGSVFSSKPDDRNGIASSYRTLGDPFLNSECLECRVFPICGGGCVKKRLEAQQDAESGIDLCSPYKESLEVYLAASIDIYHKREICDIIFGHTDWPTMDKGYRLIDPYYVFK